MRPIIKPAVRLPAAPWSEHLADSALIDIRAWEEREVPDWAWVLAWAAAWALACLAAWVAWTLASV